MTQASKKLRQIGNEKKWSLFTTPQFAAEEDDLHPLAMACAAVLPNFGYYLAHGRNGSPTVLFLIDDPKLGPLSPVDLLRFSNEFLQALSTIRDHRRALELHAKARGFVVEKTKDAMIIRDGKGCFVEATFDAKNRLGPLKQSLRKECLLAEDASPPQ